MVVVMGMPDTSALERIWICTQSVQPLARQMRKCRHFLAFLASLLSPPWLRRRFVCYAYNLLVRQMKTLAFSLDSLRVLSVVFTIHCTSLS